MDYKDQNLCHYDENAVKLAASYNSAPIEQSLPAFVAAIDKIKADGKTALDLGCGGGGDAAWLAAKGFDVVGVDGSAGMLDQCRAAHPTSSVRWLLDTAPDLPALTQLNIKFDIVLMAAFIFHLNTDDRLKLLENILRFLKEDAFIYLQLRRGPVPEGRVMYHVETGEIKKWAENKGFFYIYHGPCGDNLGRDDVSWDHISLVRGALV